MTNRTFTIGRVFNIPIKLHESLLWALGILGFLGLLSGFPLMEILFSFVGIFASVALHELGHAWVAMQKGSSVKEIVLSPLGGVAKIQNIPTTPSDEIQVALAGPAVSLLLALLCRQSYLLHNVAYVNTMLFLFNILPVFPMDGGRVLRAWLSPKKGRLEATRIAVGTAKYFCILFAMIGIANANFFMLIFIAFYIYRAGKTEYQMLKREEKANWPGFRDGHVDVEVSPPPYAIKEDPLHPLKTKLSDLLKKWK